MQNLATPRGKGGRIDLPSFTGGGDQHAAGHGARLPQRAPAGDRGGRSPGGLQSKLHIGVERGVGRRVFQDDLIQADLELLGDEGRFGGVGALAHLHHGHDQADGPAGRDANEGVGSEARRGLRPGPRAAQKAESDRKADTGQQVASIRSADAIHRNQTARITPLRAATVAMVVDRDKS